MPLPQTQTPLNPALQRRGVLLFLCALVAFASYDAFAKHMLERHSPAVMNLTRYAAVTTMALVLLWRERAAWHSAWRFWQQPHLGLLVTRSLMLAVVATSFMTALVTMPLAEATAIYFTAPLIMVALSPLLLGESVGRRQWLAVGGGFVGMLLIVRPGASLPLVGTLLMALSAVCYALFQMLTRKLSGRVAPQTQYAYMAVICLLVTSLPGLLLPGLQPDAAAGAASVLGDWPELALLLAGGVCSGLAQLLLLAAFQRAPASVLGPLNYVQLVLAVLLSTFWFGRAPDGPALAGMACIAAAGVYLAWPRGVRWTAATPPRTRSQTPGTR
ncbi:MAG: Riboflavin transporter [Paracidovorax wautersii]|uniref:Riboflavin transporter n=1 Tax=Paracidovorax wautersii TaxID=1177982 RepID=A0A7V8JPY5_9BURK|nr:MAG: Riboflavin transporter [Paracidovorax wautersii]